MGSQWKIDCGAQSEDRYLGWPLDRWHTQDGATCVDKLPGSMVDVSFPPKAENLFSGWTGFRPS